MERKLKRIILFTLFCMLCFTTSLFTKNVFADDVVYTTEGGTWVQVSENTFTMDKDGDGTTDITLVKNGNEWKYIFTVADDKATYYAWEENIPDGYEVVGKGTRANPAVNAVTKYSHTPNISDDGVQSGNYSNSYSNTDVVTIPDSEKLHVVLTYGGESASYDWVSVWEGSHPDYTASSNYSTGITVNNTQKFGGGNGTTVEFDVTGDSVTFGFRSDGSGVGNGYGYYAVVTGVGSGLTITNRSIDNPAPESGAIELSKKVTGKTVNPDEVKQYFKFNVKLFSDDADIAKLLSGDRIYGNTTFKDGEGLVYLAADDTVILDEVPAGVNYTITEDKNDDYEVSWSGNAGNSNENSYSGTIVANTTQEITCTNAYTKNPDNPDTPAEYGNLKLVKNFVNPSDTKEAILHIAFWGLDNAVKYKYSDGTAEYEFASDSTGLADVEVSVNDDQEFSFNNLPAGCKYQISEDASEYIASYEISGATNITQQRGENVDVNQSLTTAKETLSKDDNAVVTFTNTGKEIPKTVDTVNINVNKVWVDNDNALKTRPENITVQLTQDEDVVATAVLEDGNNWSTSFTDMDKFHEDGVTEYEYAVNEVEVPGYESEITSSTNSDIKSFTITNTLIDIGNLKVTKTVEGDGADLTQDFRFTVNLTKDGNPVQGTFNLDNTEGTKTGSIAFNEKGQATFTLKHGESIFIKDIPAGASWTVKETVSEGFTEANNGEYSGTITKGKTSEANVVNTFNPNHKMTITKTVKGNQGDKTKEFSFQMMLTGNNIPSNLSYTKNGKSSTLTVKNGIAEFTLAHEDEIVFGEMPAGVKYTIAELDGTSNGYTVESKNASGTIDNDVNVSFINTKNVGVPTAAMTNTSIVFGIVVVCGIIALMVWRKNKQ